MAMSFNITWFNRSLYFIEVKIKPENLDQVQNITLNFAHIINLRNTVHASGHIRPISRSSWEWPHTSTYKKKQIRRATNISG